MMFQRSLLVTFHQSNNERFRQVVLPCHAVCEALVERACASFLPVGKGSHCVCKVGVSLVSTIGSDSSGWVP